MGRAAVHWQLASHRHSNEQAERRACDPLLLAATAVCQALPSKEVVGTVALSGLKVTTPVGIVTVTGPAPPSKVSVWDVMPIDTAWLVATAVA